MSADAESHPNFPRNIASESSTIGSSTVPPRKLARLLFDFDRPFYLLDSQDRVRFVNRALVEALKTSEAVLVGLDCSRTLPCDEHPQPALAGLLAIPENSRPKHVSFSSIGSSTAPWTCRIVIPLDSIAGPHYVACFWLRADDPLVIQASRHVDWLAHVEIRNALLDARRTLSRMDGLHSLIGNSPSALLARSQSQAAIAGDMSVCLYGPVGSGKATLARAIYQQRRKRERKRMSGGGLLPIDCRLMDRSLMQETIELATETETSRRAVTDSDSTAILLSSLDLLGADAFEPLARFLREYPTTTIFATSRTEALNRLHTDQAWHEIVSRSNVMSIHLEPLSNRIEDIAPLAESILEEIRIATSGQVLRFFSASTLQWLQAYPWPGNHRELSQAIHDACQKSMASKIEPNHFSLAIRTFASHVLKPEPMASLNLDQALEDFERGILQKAIDAFPRNRAAAARHLGISRTRLLRRLAQLGLETSPQVADPTEVSHAPEPAKHASDEPIFEEIHDEPL